MQESVSECTLYWEQNNHEQVKTSDIPILNTEMKYNSSDDIWCSDITMFMFW